eukprot:scaffold1982_cov93-Amphora_coffeaeformis.AAC.42
MGGFVPPTISTIDGSGRGCIGGISHDKVRGGWIQTGFGMSGVQGWHQTGGVHVLETQQLGKVGNGTTVRRVVVQFPRRKGPSHALFVGKELTIGK